MGMTVNNSNRTPIIELRGLTRTFGDITAVDDLDLTIYKGEIFGLVGPDGAGKTTTLRLLAAIMDPSGGSVSVDELDSVADAEAIKSRIGYMAQAFSLYGDLSVEENLNFFADVFSVHGATRKERIKRLLTFANLIQFKSRRGANLSGGMQKKLALACTLIHEPGILYLDEPTTGVDPVSRREFWDILTELHLQGVTIVVSTPYMDEAERCSRVGLMYEGTLIECDTPAAIKSRVPGELLEIRPDDVRRANQILKNAPGVLEVQTYGDVLHVFVEDAKSGAEAVKGTLHTAGMGVESLRQVAPRMEEAFISLIRRRQARNGASPAEAGA
jgi:ABC-2 type transport system ATP-binding protein